MEKDDQHVQQLQEIFDSFCSNGESSINRTQLMQLCEGLSLNNDSADRVCQLAFPEFCSDDKLGAGTIAFDEFCDCFVAALSEVSDSDEPDTTPQVAEERFDNEPEKVEVSPHFVRHGRPYGRKSLPINDQLGEVTMDENAAGINHLQRDESSDAKDRFANDDSNVNQIYFEPFDGEEGLRKGNYFEATGSAESYPNQRNQNQKLRRDLSTSVVESVADISVVSITGVGGMDLFSSLCVDGSPLVEVAHLMELWRQGGVPNSQVIFETLNIECSDVDTVIDGFELSRALEREVVASSLPTLPPLHHSMTSALLHSYKHHLSYTDTALQRYCHQVERMKDDLNHSELRNSMLMEEVDDRCVNQDQSHEKRINSLERKWGKKFQSVQRNFERERETLLSQAASEKEELLEEIEAVRSNEGLLRRNMEVITSENKSLSDDSVRMLGRLTEAEKDADRLRKDLECLLAAKAKDDCDPVNTSQEEQFAMIIKDYETQCRFLSDRNDELTMENRDIQSKLRQQDSLSYYNHQSFSREQKTSPSRKKTSRMHRKRSGGSLEDTDSSEVDDLSEIERRNHPRFMGSNPDDSLALNFTSARMLELEQLVEEMRREKRKTIDNFAFEKAELRATIEEEYRIKMEEQCRNFDDKKAVEEQRIMTKQLLEEMTRERDDLEKKYKELNESVQIETSSGQQEMANLCREFANEKSELVTRHNVEMKSTEESLNSANQKLEEEKLANQRLTDQLKFERSQHKEALSAHQEIINKFEKASSIKDSENASEKLKEIKEKHENEVVQLKRDHATSLKAVKHEMEEQLDTLLAERQIHENSSVCSELERLQESIGAERQEMHERMQEMREAFEREAIELRHLLDRDKTKLRQQLNEEIALLRQRIAEEGKSELERRRKEIEEQRRRNTDKANMEHKDNRDLLDLRGEVSALRERNVDLQRLLSNATSSVREQEERMRSLDETRKSEDSLLRRLDEAKQRLINKEMDISSLRRELDDVINQNKDGTMMTSLLRTRCDEKSAENSQLCIENRELSEKVRNLDEECKRIRIENVGFSAKCRALESSTHSAPIPKKRHNKEDKDKTELEKQIRSLNAEIVELRSKSFQSSRDVTPRSNDVCDDVTCEEESATSQSRNNSESIMRRRLTQTRKQLTENMGRMKDLYGKLSKSELLVKDLYCENAHLMRALQVTEARQRGAESRCEEETNKNQVLGQLLKRICHEEV